MGKRKSSVRAKYIKSAESIIKRAEANLKASQKIESQLTRQGQLAGSYNYYEGTQRMIDEARAYLASGKRLSAKFKRSIAVLKERTSKNYWLSGMKLAYNKTVRMGVNTISTPASKTVAEVYRIRKRSIAKKPITSEQQSILTTFNQAMLSLNQANAMNKTPEELVKYYRERGRKLHQRDVSYGGNSTLINDLEYSAGALPTGREFVEALQKQMQDPDMFEQIEAWYRDTSNAKANKVRDDLNHAKGSDWYVGFKSAQQILITVIGVLLNQFGKDMNDADKKLYEEVKKELDNEPESL